MQELQDLLTKALGKRGLLEHATASHVTHSARTWLHERLPDFADRIHVTTFRDAVLTIKCDHSIVTQECQMLKHDLMHHLKSTFGADACDDIRIIRS